uniref:FBD domain-containing protein n=1 Tax=Aegilops tauschii subsp. strangulata TaxID=200361 RepID=A0A453GU97_AEGTS
LRRRRRRSGVAVALRPRSSPLVAPQGRSTRAARPSLVIEETTLPKAQQSVPIAHDKESHVKKSLGDLSGIKTLGISGIFMKYLSKWCILTKFPAVFHRLEHICLVICFWDQRQVLATCSLFQNAPNLKKLDMWSQSLSTWDQDQASIPELTMQVQLDHLVTASVKGFRGVDYEVNFLAKLLSWAPALEEVKIEWTGKTECSMVLAKLLALPRVSPRAKVIVTFL